MLVPHFQKDSEAHIVSVVVLINEKVRQKQLNVWDVLLEASLFSSLFQSALEMLIAPLDKVALNVRYQLLTFVGHAFDSMELAPVRTECLALVNIGIWHCMVDKESIQDLINTSEDWTRLWNKANKKYSTASAEAKKQLDFNRSFLSKLTKLLFVLIDQGKQGLPQDTERFCDLILSFFIDLLALLPTRRYFHALFQDHLFIPIVNASEYFKWSQKRNGLFSQLFKRIKHFATFQIDDVTGLAQNEEDLAHDRHKRISKFQKVAFVKFKEEMDAFVFCSPGPLKTPKSIKDIFQDVSDETLGAFCTEIGIRTADFTGTDIAFNRAFLLEALVWKLQHHPNEVDAILGSSLYPSEKFLFDDATFKVNHVAQVRYHCHPVPKLNLQFLTIYDYLIRQYHLFRLESSFALRKDVENALLRLAPRYNPDGEHEYEKTIFGGWCRDALPLSQIQVDEIGPPRLTEMTPSYVTAELSFSLSKYSHFS